MLGEYAPWHTDELNITIRQVSPGEVPGLRYLGREDKDLGVVIETRAGNGILWEEFSAEQQLQEILRCGLTQSASSELFNRWVYKIIC